MEKILNSIAFVLYVLVSIIVLCIAMLYPITFGSSGFDWFNCITIYSFTILICATQNKMLNYFSDRLDF